MKRSQLVIKRIITPLTGLFILGISTPGFAIPYSLAGSARVAVWQDGSFIGRDLQLNGNFDFQYSGVPFEEQVEGDWGVGSYYYDLTAELTVHYDGIAYYYPAITGYFMGTTDASNGMRLSGNDGFLLEGHDDLTLTQLFHAPDNSDPSPYPDAFHLNLSSVADCLSICPLPPAMTAGSDYYFFPHGSGDFHFTRHHAQPVPEPATILLLGSGLVAFAGHRARSRRQAAG